MEQAAAAAAAAAAGNLLSPNQANSKASSKSIESSNSTTFSAGFLPSPDVHTPSNQSSMIGFNQHVTTATVTGGSSSSFCAVALATATIGSSILLTQEQQELLKQQITYLRRPSYADRPSFKGNFLSAFAHAAAKKLTTSSSLIPVRNYLLHDWIFLFCFVIVIVIFVVS